MCEYVNIIITETNFLIKIILNTIKYLLYENYLYLYFISKLLNAMALLFKCKKKKISLLYYT